MLEAIVDIWMMKQIRISSYTECFATAHEQVTDLEYDKRNKHNIFLIPQSPVLPESRLALIFPRHLLAWSRIILSGSCDPIVVRRNHWKVHFKLSGLAFWRTVLTRMFCDKLRNRCGYRVCSLCHFSYQLQRPSYAFLDSYFRHHILAIIFWYGWLHLLTCQTAKRRSLTHFALKRHRIWIEQAHFTTAAFCWRMITR